MLRLRLTLAVLILGGGLSAQTKQWPAFVLSYCSSTITIQLDRNMSVQEPKGTIVTLTTNASTRVEGNTSWPKATVEFDPRTKLVSHIWFVASSSGMRQESGCPGEQSRQAPQRTDQASQGANVSDFDRCRGVQPELMMQRAAAGNAPGEFCAAYFYLEGTAGIRKNPGEGLRRMRHAAELGYAPAQVRMGDFSKNGDGVLQDYRAAESWYLKAAAQGSGAAAADLAELYLDGPPGVRKDRNEALKWAREASRQNYPGAYNLLTRINSLAAASTAQVPRKEPAQDLWEEGVRLFQSGDQAGAAKPILRAAQAGNSLAQMQIGFQYEKGIGVPKSYVEAARWYRKAADQGDAAAMKNIGQLYEEGLGVPEDWMEAARWYGKSADLANREGEGALARAYQFGIGVPQNRKISIQWDERAAAQGDSRSAYYARWLRDPTNNIGFRNDQEQALVLAGKLRFGVQLIGGDPAGVTFRNSTERFAWLLLQRKALDKDEADTWWSIRQSEYERCQRNHEDYCREPGPRPR
jgi:uncharacterized protein